MFDSDSSGGHFCTAGVVNSPGHDVIVIDRSGKATPMKITVGNGTQTALAGYPLDPGTDTAAVWTNNGLFVWGGDQTSRTSSRTDAARYTTKK